MTIVEFCVKVLALNVSEMFLKLTFFDELLNFNQNFQVFGQQDNNLD